MYRRGAIRTSRSSPGNADLSLVHFVEAPRMRDAFKSALRKDWPRPAGMRDWPLLVPVPGNRASSSGSAFDYLSRFRLLRMGRERDGLSVRDFRWVAEDALAELGARPGWRDMHLRHSRHMEVAKRLVEDWVAGFDDVYARVVDVAQWLSRLDLWVRLDDRLDPERRRWIDPAVRDDLFALDKVFVEADPFAGASNVLLNPRFVGGALVDKADADYLADDGVVELKAVGEAAFKAPFMRQLCGYAVLHNLHGGVDLLDGTAHVEPVSRIGVYFARHGRRVDIDLSDLFVPGGMEAYAMAFVEEAASLPDPRDLSAEAPHAMAM